MTPLDLSFISSREEKISFLQSQIQYLVAEDVFEKFKKLLTLKKLDFFNIWKDIDDEEDFSILSFSIEFPDDADSGYHPNNVLEEYNIPEIEDVTFASIIKEDFTFNSSITFQEFLNFLKFNQNI